MNTLKTIRKETKHETVALEHMNTLGIDKILIESLKLLTKQEAIPANPYAIIYRNVVFSKIKY